MWEYKGADHNNDWLQHYKYVKRERIGDKWRYWYTDAKERVSTGVKDLKRDVTKKYNKARRKVKWEATKYKIEKKIKRGKQYVKDLFKDASYEREYRDKNGDYVRETYTGNKIFGRSSTSRISNVSPGTAQQLEEAFRKTGKNRRK